MRQAIAHAINKKAIVDAFYGGPGLVAKQLQPPALWGYNKDIKDYEYSPGQGPGSAEAGGLPQRLQRDHLGGREEGAARLLVHAACRAPYFPNPKEIGEAMAADLAKVGIKGQLQTVEWANYLDKRKKGVMPLYMLGWTGDNGDPDNFLCFFFCPPNVPRRGLLQQPAALRRAEARADAHQPGRAGEALPAGRADDPR